MLDKKFQRVIVLFVLVIIVGCIYVYPDMRFIYELKDDYRGIIFSGTIDELTYLGRINAFYKGSTFTLSGFDNYEHLGQPWTFGFFPEVFLGSIAKLLGISVVNLDILMSFLLPALLFILIYALTFKLSAGSEYLSLLASLSILLGYHAFTTIPSILKNIFSLTHGAPLWFLRPVSPQFNHIMLILTLLFIYKALDSKKVYALWISAALLGLLFYTFIYYWTFIYSGLFILILIFALRKNFNLVRRIIFIVIISSIISIPYWINFWRLIHSPKYSSLAFFIGVQYSRVPIIPIHHLVLTLFIFIAYYRKRDSLQFSFIAAFLLGGLICVNQHLISGKTLYPGHWLNYSNKTFLIIAIFSSLINFKDSYFIKKIKNSSIRLFIAGPILLFLIFLGFMQQNVYYNTSKCRYIQKQPLSGVFSWLKEHTGKNDVVLINPFNSMRNKLPTVTDMLVYTNCYSFLPVTDTSLQSKEELEDRYFISLVLFGYNQDEVEEFITYNNGVHFVLMGSVVEYGGKGIQPEYVGYLKDKFRLFLDERELFLKLSKYRLNYILVSNDDDRMDEIEAWRKNNISITKVYDDGKFSIFEFQIRIEREEDERYKENNILF